VTTGRTGAGGRYRPERRRRASTALLTLLAAAIAATLLAALGARALLARATCAGQTTTARVAVSGDIAPVIQRLAAFFDSEHRQVDGRCAAVAVRTAPAATVAAGLARAARRNARPPASAWIPDSGLWVDLARGSPQAAALVRPSGIVVAETPLVIVMPRAAAARMPAFGSSVGWQMLLPQRAGGPPTALGLDVQFPDPAQCAAGLAGLIEVRRLVGHGRAARTKMALFALNAQVVHPGNAGRSLPSLDAFASAPGGATTAPLTVTSEQAVVQFDRSHPAQPLAVRYPAQGTFQLTYPYVLTGSAGPALAAAKAFGGVLRSAYASAYVRYEGFRTPTGAAGAWPGYSGLASAEPRSLPAPGAGQAGQALRAWHVLGLGSRILVVQDVSESMAARAAPGGATLEQAFGHAAAAGMRRFPNGTQMGLWVFASDLAGSRPYRQLVPVGPLAAQFGALTRGQAIRRLAAMSRPVPHAGAALYGTLLAAYKQMAITYQPQYVNAVLVLTAGVENAPGDIPAATLLRELRALASPRRPVEILMAVAGRPPALRTLEQIAAVANGKVWPRARASQIPRIFGQASGRRP
jgi:hypothetical protein